MARDCSAVAWISGAQVGECGGYFVCDAAPGDVEAAVDPAAGAAWGGGLTEGDEGEVCDEVLD